MSAEAMTVTNAINNTDSFNGFVSSVGTQFVPSVTSGSTWTTTADLTLYNQACYTPYYYAVPGKTEKAYQVIRALMKAKVLKIQSITRFFEVMDEVTKAF